MTDDIERRIFLGFSTPKASESFKKYNTGDKGRCGARLSIMNREI